VQDLISDVSGFDRLILDLTRILQVHRDGGEIWTNCLNASLVIIVEFAPVGCTVLTRIRSGAHSFAHARIRPTTPCLDAMLTHHPGVSVRHAAVESRGRAGGDDRTVASAGADMRRRGGGGSAGVPTGIGERIPGIAISAGTTTTAPNASISRSLWRGEEHGIDVINFVPGRVSAAVGGDMHVVVVVGGFVA
jgi:hypothetical protein